MASSGQMDGLREDYLDDNYCDLHYYVKRPKDKNGRKIHVVKSTLETKNSTFIKKHRIVDHCIKIETMIPHIFYLLLEYVYLSLNDINCQQLSPDEVDELLKAARFYEVRCLVNKIINYLTQDLVLEVKPKSLFWLLDHYFMNRINAPTAQNNWRLCVQNLSSHPMTMEELNQAQSLSFLHKDCLDSLLQSNNFTWTVEQKFQLVCVWTRQQLDDLGIPFNPHNIALFLGHTISYIRLDSLGCRSFINTVYNSDFLTQEKCMDILVQIMGRRAGTISVNYQPQAITAHIKRFNERNILSGKRYGPRTDRHIQQRRRRRNRTRGIDIPINQQNRASNLEEERRLAVARDMAEIRERESDRAQPDIGFENPHPVTQTVSITNRDDQADTLSFMCSCDARLNQIEIFGSDGGREGHYHIELKIIEGNNIQNPRFARTYELDTNGVIKFYPLDISPPVDITKHQVYTIYMVMNGPSSYFGLNGNTEVGPDNAGNMIVFFIPKEIGLNGTNTTRGQFFSITLEKFRALSSRN